MLATLAANSIFNVLAPEIVARRELLLDASVKLADRDERDLGLEVRAFPVPGKVALYLENAAAGPGFGTRPGDALGLEVRGADGRGFFYLPGSAEMPPALAWRLKGAALVFFDGTLWRDDEMIAAGVGTKTGRRMGHMSVSGPEGSLASFAPLGVRRKIFVHVNNTNPILLDDSPDRAEVAAGGWEVAFDGMEIVL